jgi:hypothetical protein
MTPQYLVLTEEAQGHKPYGFETINTRYCDVLIGLQIVRLDLLDTRQAMFTITHNTSNYIT